METAIALHFHILRKVSMEHGGHESSTEVRSQPPISKALHADRNLLVFAQSRCRD
jgi:hypothetical protein